MNIYIEVASSMMVGGGLVYLLTKTYFIEKIKLSIKNDYDIVIENLRGDITSNHTVLSTVLSSQMQSSHEGQTERLSAIKLLWNVYIIIRNSLVEINRIDSVLLEEEFNTLFTDQWKGNDYAEQHLKSVPWNRLEVLSGAIEKIEPVRPFLNEQIWLNINFLKTFTGRIIYLYKTAYENRSIIHWKEDVALGNLVKEALSEDELKFLEKSNIGSIGIFQNFIEQKILAEIQSIVTGQVASDNTYQRAIHLMKSINDSKKNE